MITRNVVDRGWLWAEVILLFSAFFLPGFILQTRAAGGPSFDDPVYSISILLQSLPQILLVLYIVYIGGKGNLEEFGFCTPKWEDGLRGLVVLAATFAVLVPIQLLLGDATDDHDAFRFTYGNLAIAPLVLIATIAAGYREEVFFRAYALTRLEQLEVPPVVAAIATNLFFSLGHLYQGLGGIVVSFSIGLLMAAVFLRTRNLHAVGIGHGLYNFVVLLASGLSRS